MTPDPVKAAAMKAAGETQQLALRRAIANDPLRVEERAAIIERHYRELLAGQIADYEVVLADKRRLAREIDMAMHGEAGAAKQPSLCDVLSSVRDFVGERAAAAAQIAELEEVLRVISVGNIFGEPIDGATAQELCRAHPPSPRKAPMKLTDERVQAIQEWTQDHCWLPSRDSVADLCSDLLEARAELVKERELSRRRHWALRGFAIDLDSDDPGCEMCLETWPSGIEGQHDVDGCLAAPEGD